MSQETDQVHITRKPLVYRPPAANRVTVRRDVEYRVTDAGSLTMDLYDPPGSSSERRAPAVIFVSGYSDPGFEAMLGCKLKEVASYIGWGELAAASGMVGITYSATDPVADTQELLRYVRQNAASLGIDESRIGLWACSGNVPNALALLTGEDGDALRCGVLCYGFLLDLEGSTHVAEAAASFGFVNPAAGKTIDDFPSGLPLFIVRAGQDEFPHLNDTLDRFVAAALASNLPITLVNHAAAPHAFDIMHDSDTSREIIRNILEFLQFHLSAVGDTTAGR